MALNANRCAVLVATHDPTLDSQLDRADAIQQKRPIYGKFDYDTPWKHLLGNEAKTLAADVTKSAKTELVSSHHLPANGEIDLITVL